MTNPARSPFSCPGDAGCWMPELPQSGRADAAKPPSLAKTMLHPWQRIEASLVIADASMSEKYTRNGQSGAFPWRKECALGRGKPVDH